MQFRLTWKTHIQSIALALIAMATMPAATENIISGFYSQELMLYPTQSISLNFYLYIMLFLAPLTLLHEALHSLAYMIFGGRVRLGFKFIYAYTMEVSEKSIKRVQFLIALLLPLMVISLMTPLLNTWWADTFFLLNLLGSSGDFIMALSLCRYNHDTYIIDRDYGFEVVEKVTP